MSDSEYSSDDGDTREDVSFDEIDGFEDDNPISNYEQSGDEDGEDEDNEEYDEHEDSQDDNEEGGCNINGDDEDDQEEMHANRESSSAGDTIASQFELFDGLMGMRIRQQEMLMNINKLPQPLNYQQFRTKIGQSFSSSTKGVMRCLQQVLDNLLDLQEKLMEADKIGIPFKKQKLSDDKDMDEEITSDEDEKDDEDVNGSKEDEDDIGDEESDAVEVKDNIAVPNKNLEDLMNKRHTSLRVYRTRLLKELSEKVKFATTNAKQDDFKSLSIPINKQIDQVLEKKESLIERTQTKRLVYKVLGKEVDQLAHGIDGTEVECKVVTAKDPEIFDDYDFYCRLMTDLTNRKIATSQDMVEISRRWAELNNLRTKTIKKSLVDHNASKGRKTRYNIIKRLIGLPDIELAIPMDNKECDAIFNQIFNQSDVKSGQSWLFKPMES